MSPAICRGCIFPPNVGSVASVSTAPVRHASLVGTGFLDLNAGGRQLKRARGRKDKYSFLLVEI